jgi:hypothetical protein
MINVLLFVLPVESFALPIDLSNSGFFESDVNHIQYDEHGNATLTEDEFSGVTYLSNDPYLGDPGFNIELDFQFLSLDYIFYTSGSDSFEVSLLDSNGNADYANYFHDGISSGPGNFSGNLTFDLISMGLIGSVIGLEFVLTSDVGDATFDAALVIENAEFITSDIVTVPEPSSITILFFVLALSLIVRSNKYC